MNIELLIHGVPNGHDYYGPQEDQQYASTFYSLSSPYRERFQIEVRKVGERLYSYFHYLLSGNIVAADSRKGGYFALSLRMDCFVNCPLTICSILETVCKTKVIGNILATVEQNLKYTAPTFAQHNSTISAIEDELGRLLTHVLTSSNTTAINPLFVGSQQGVVVRNLRDTSNADVFNCLTACGKVVLSPFAQTISEGEYIKTVNACNAQIETLLNETKKLKCELEDTKNEVLEMCQKLSKYAEAEQPQVPAQPQVYPQAPPSSRRHLHGNQALFAVIIAVVIVFIVLIAALLYFSGIFHRL